uniref:Nuclear receptor domain-containing protein n=1 Tax=Panagrolaimus sp. PS1159 TaxID=55785 RepID=A0AC35GP04_9BILA
MEENNQLISIPPKHLINRRYAPCLICSSPTSILHLKTNVCAACSAFYRRSLKLSKTFQCQRNTRDCDLTIKKSGRQICRYCRFQKCFQLGMKLKSKIDNEVIYEQPEMPTLYDFSYIFEYVTTLYKQPTMCIKLNNINYTEQFGKLMANFIEVTKPMDTPIKLKDENLRLNCTKSCYLHIARMLLNYTPFSALPFKDKVLLHHEFWQLFIELGRVYQTLQYFGTDLDDSRLFADFHQYRDQSIQITNEMLNSDGCVSFLIPLKEKLGRAVKNFKKFNPTFFEFSHICQIMLWSRYEFMNLSNSTNQIAEKIMQQLSDDLHNYYVNDLKIEAYANRQSNLYKIISIGNVIINDERQMFQAHNIFSFGKEYIPACKFKHSYFNFVNKRVL